LKIAAIQMRHITEDKATNMTYASRLLAEAAKAGVDMACLGELFTTRYFCVGDTDDRAFSWAETIPGPTTDHLAEIAKSHSMAIVAGLYEKEGDTYYNTSVIIDKKGQLISKYRKAHLADLQYAATSSIESYYFAKGNLGFPVVEMDGVKIGMMICYDRSFAESWRALKRKGARLSLFLPLRQAGAAKNGSWNYKCARWRITCLRWQRIATAMREKDCFSAKAALSTLPEM
jgi:predicted amidohydrolase